VQWLNAVAEATAVAEAGVPVGEVSTVAVVEAFAVAVVEGSGAASVAVATAEVSEASAAASAAAATGTATVADTGSGSALASDRGLIGLDHIMAITIRMDIHIIPTIRTPRAIPTVRTDVIPTVMVPMPMLPTLREVDPGRRRIP
jgi:hypothetical protein